MYILLFYKEKPLQTAIGQVFNWALTYKKTQQHISNTIEIVETFKSHIKTIVFTLKHFKEIV